MYLQLPSAQEPVIPQPVVAPYPQPLVHPFAPYAVPPTRNIHIGSPHVKVDVQTTRRSSVEEPENIEVSSLNITNWFPQ